MDIQEMMENLDSLEEVCLVDALKDLYVKLEKELETGEYSQSSRVYEKEGLNEVNVAETERYTKLRFATVEAMLKSAEQY